MALWWSVPIGPGISLAGLGVLLWSIGAVRSKAT